MALYCVTVTGVTVSDFSCMNQTTAWLQGTYNRLNCTLIVTAGSASETASDLKVVRRAVDCFLKSEATTGGAAERSSDPESAGISCKMSRRAHFCLAFMCSNVSPTNCEML